MSPEASNGPVPAWPRIHAITREDGSAEVTVNGTSHPVGTTSLEAARDAVIDLIAQTATKVGRPVRATASGPEGTFALIVHPDGTVHADQAEAPLPPAPPPPVPALAPPIGPTPPEPETGAAGAPGPPGRDSFLVAPPSGRQAETGLRGALARVGITVPLSRRQREIRDDVHAVSRHWPGPRTVAVVNTKGGAGKTPTTAMLAAIFARNGGAGVLAWDNNQTQGTLGWRTEQGPHEATVRDLLPEAPALMAAGSRAADVARFVHHQTADRYDVLRSAPVALTDRPRLGRDDLDAVHAVATRFYRIVVMDSGNDPSDPLWLGMIDHADQLVVSTSTRDDHAEAGAVLLETLAGRDEHAAALAARAVVVLTRADPGAPDDLVRRVTRGYGALARRTVVIPHDPALVQGRLRFDVMRRATQRAWLAAGAAVADGL